MPRGRVHVAIRFAYQADAFEGYARQTGKRTVEQTLIDALQRTGLVAGSWKTGSRTDAGVHAACNVARVEVARKHLRGWVAESNKHLPHDLVLTGAQGVSADWNPRHALWREYAYFAVRRDESLAAMQAACRLLVGTHDVRGLARVESGKNPVRTVTRFAVHAHAAGWKFKVRGPSFLWNQVRRMVDAVLAVGQARIGLEDLSRILETGRANTRLSVAPAEGLVLQEVKYRGLRFDEGGKAPSGRRRVLPEAYAQLEVAKRITASAFGP